MSIFEITMAYAISWFLTLFLVLPFGVQVSGNPGKGHAPSAPTQPRLRRKFLITSLLAIIPVVLFGLAKSAMAESGMYHAGGDEECADYAMPEGVEASSDTTSPETIRSGISVPTADYISDPDLRDKLYTSETYVGAVDVNRQGETRLNGKLIAGGGCKEK